MHRSENGNARASRIPAVRRIRDDTDSRWQIAGAVASGALAIDFVETPPGASADHDGRGSCFNAEGGGHQGRLWFDPVTFDIRQVDVRLVKAVPGSMPTGYFGLHPAIRVERWEATHRFSRVNFSQPDEAVLLPESVDTLSVFRGAPSLRITQKLSNFRRFLSESTIRSSAF